MTIGLYEKALEHAHGAARPARVRASAAAIPWRRTAEGDLEVFWVRRAPGVPFMAGWHAFPGGGVSRRDAGIPSHGSPEGLSSDEITPPLPDLRDVTVDDVGGDEISGLVVAALRELFEETGLLLLQSRPEPDDGAPARRLELDADTLHRERLALLDRETTLEEILDRHEAVLDASPLVFAGRWMTPPLAPIRFDNRFFLLEWPQERSHQPAVLGRELDQGTWIRPADALAAWQAGDAITAPPILHTLRVLAEDGPVEGRARLLSPTESDLGPMRRIEFRPGIVLVPLRTATLPPASHTHAFLVGTDPAVLVDPGCHDENEIRILFEVLRAFADRGGRVDEIWLTHHHPDHVGAVRSVQQELGIPLRAHPSSADGLARFGLEISTPLVDGEVRELGASRLRVVHTPGHTRGHLAFFDETTGSLLAGDLVSSLSTIVVDPPEGDMDQYIDSLDRALDLEPTTVFPSHGPVLLGSSRIRETRDHRLAREAAIREAWTTKNLREATTIAQLVYEDTPTAFLPLAARQVQAHLDRLSRRGEIS